MTDVDDKKSLSEEGKKKPLSLGSASGKLTLKSKPSVGSGVKTRVSGAQGRSTTVTVEHKRKRGPDRSQTEPHTQIGDLSQAEMESRQRALKLAATHKDESIYDSQGDTSQRDVSDHSKSLESLDESVNSGLQDSQLEDGAESHSSSVQRSSTGGQNLRNHRRQLNAEELRALEEQERREIEAQDQIKREVESQEAAKRREGVRLSEERRRAARKPTVEERTVVQSAAVAVDKDEPRSARKPSRDDDDDHRVRRTKGTGERRRGKMTTSQLINNDGTNERQRSLAALKRAKNKEKRQALGDDGNSAHKIVREVQLPEFITVQDLAGRMAERAGDVIKALMKSGVMATVNQSVDADTAEIIVSEFGHKVVRISESDVESVLQRDDDREEDKTTRPPVVTVMGHVDHGKTSLLDAFRASQVAAREAGGITQHIGAYQLEVENGRQITFIDTPGHSAFSEMRRRGASVTDIVVLVVAANDGVMPQTVEAINHALAANVPIIVAINKIDLPNADPSAVSNGLLQHNVILEDLGGETQSVKLSAKTGEGLDALKDAILLQAEILELKANANAKAEAVVIESRLEKGRGSVATVLVERGTLRVGDVFVVGAETGRVRALLNDHGASITSAVPGTPAEILGLNGQPRAGDNLAVVATESEARQISEFRQRKERDAKFITSSKGATLEQMFAASKGEGQPSTLQIVIKGDVHGSLEAIEGALTKMTQESGEDISVRVLHSAVGEITESDVTLASASSAMVIGFNVRANPQAREMAQRDKLDIRYYSIIYNVLDDIKAILGGLLSPELHEQFTGYADIRQVFNISKSGRIAGCMVTEGTVHKGAKVRLLRDNIVIHEGYLKTLKRFKDDVREVQNNMECGMAFESYDDIREGDRIEAFVVTEHARTL